MDHVPDWLANIHEIGHLNPAVAGLICIGVSALSGALIGIERERRDKPAGVRTVMLISLGSTIFTIVSILMSQQKAMADPARLAAQVVTGVGFLGAGAILHARGTIVGLTTGATIWAVAAVGVTIGSGYVAAGVVFTIVIFFVLTVERQLMVVIAGRCRKQAVRIVFNPDRGKAWPQIQSILDRHRIRDAAVRRGDAEDGLQCAETKVCVWHRDHRLILTELAELGQVAELRIDEG